MKLKVSDEIVQKYPALRISFLTVRGMRNGEVPPALAEELRAAEASVRQRFADAAALEADPRISGWRDIYKSFNVNPKKFRPSAEALLRRVVKGDALPDINAATNAYLLPQLTYLLPVGGYDLAHVRGDLTLRFSPGGESFVGIGAREPEQTEAGEIVYADEGGVLTRRWNFKDADHTKITPESRDVALFVEAPLPQMTSEDLRGLAQAIADAVKRHCGGEVKTGFLDVQQAREVEL